MQQQEKIMEVVKKEISVSQTPAETVVPGKAIKKSGKRIGYNYIILKSLKQSQKNDVVKCLYIKSLINFGICVIKEGTYGDSKDKEGRDIKDKLMWQKQLHEQLQDKVRLPKYLGSFEENGNYYLVIERIKGLSLAKLCKEKFRDIRYGLLTGNKLGIHFLNYMIQLTSVLESLHENQIVHRDVSANNFIISSTGKVSVIDMELSYSLSQNLPSPPFQLGTYGYMSPQQESMQLPSTKDDIFSLGAIMLQIWTGISPTKLTYAQVEQIHRKVIFFIPDQSFADMVIQCLHPDREKRPALNEIRMVIEEYKKNLTAKKIRSLTKPALFTNNEITDTIQNVISTIASPLLADEENGWFSEDHNKPTLFEKSKINKGWYASFNKGAAGIIYLLSRAKKSGFDTGRNDIYVQKALSLIEKKYIDQLPEVSPGLCFGSSGIAASLSTAIEEKLFEPLPAHFNWIDKLITIENSNLDFAQGITGHGIANWLCSRFLQEQQMQKRLENYVDRLLASQEKNGAWISHGDKNKIKITRGFARGVAGNTYFLLEYAKHYQEREPLAAAKNALQWLIKISKRRKNSVEWLSQSNKNIGYSFSEGSAGIALAFIKAYTLLGESKYKEYAIAALSGIPENIIDNNLSQYFGLSGIGEVYVEAYDVFKDEIWLNKATMIAQVIMNTQREHKTHGPYWLTDHERQPVADFMYGNTGVLHFLLRYLYPDKISFPLLNH